MEGAGGDEQDVVGAHQPVLGGHRRALDDRQQVALHPLAADIGAARVGLGADLVDLVQKDDAVLFDRLDRLAGDRFLVDQLVGLLGDQQIIAFGHLQLALDGAAAERLSEDVAQVHHTHVAARLARDLHHREGAGAVRDLEFDLLVVEHPVAQLLAEHLAGLLARVGPRNGRDHAILGRVMGARLDLFAHLRADHHDRAVDQVAHDLLDVAADIAHLGELRRLDLEERRLGQLRQPAADLGLADAGGPDHQDVLRVHLLAHLGVQLLAPPAVAQGHRDRPLGLGLADDEAVQFGYDFARGEFGHKPLRVLACCA